jgi:hypothetical protein
VALPAQVGGTAQIDNPQQHLGMAAGSASSATLRARAVTVTVLVGRGIGPSSRSEAVGRRRFRDEAVALALLGIDGGDDALMLALAS